MKLKLSKLILISLLALILLGTGIVFGKYMSEQKINANSTIAKPIIEIERGENINIDDNNPNAEYEFVVKNYNNKDNITDTSMNYVIEIIESGDSSISYNLFRDNKEVPLNNNKTAKIAMGRNKKEKHNYILKINYDKSKSDEYTDFTEDIGIKIHSEQTI